MLVCVTVISLCVESRDMKYARCNFSLLLEIMKKKNPKRLEEITKQYSCILYISHFVFRPKRACEARHALNLNHVIYIYST